MLSNVNFKDMATGRPALLARQVGLLPHLLDFAV